MTPAMSQSFAVTAVDHVELLVTDWDESAAWYDRVLGFSPDGRYREWWMGGDGPLVLTADGVATKLALFEEDGVRRGASVSPHRVAFRTDGDGFLSFLHRLDDLELRDGEGTRVEAEDVVDHGLSFSIYFADLDGTPLELTTYDVETVAAGRE